MKTLYESILDNEDILMNDIKKHSNNPFRVLKYYYDDLRLHLDKSWLSKWYNAVDDVMKQVDLPSGVKYYTMMYSIKFISRRGNDLFEIKFDNESIKSFTKKDACCVMVDSTRDRSNSLSDREIKIVRDFCKQYDFKLTNPNHAYCMWLYLDK